jgi:hypothetical protein
MSHEVSAFVEEDAKKIGNVDIGPLTETQTNSPLPVRHEVSIGI